MMHGGGGTKYTLEQANRVAVFGYRIFAVSAGVSANQSLMQEIADIASGEHFRAEGTIDQYSDRLAEIFRRLGGKRPVELIQ